MIKEFVCAKCNTVFEKRFANFTAFDKERNSTPCSNQNCKYIAAPLVSRTAPPQFKGSGFYQTDYKGR
jgi:predicted nucleic acid-binding Zn ribbon protein